MKIGVLGLQGSVKEHLKLIERNGDEGVIVKENDDLTTLDGLVIPGGESTTLNKLLKIKKLDEGIIEHSYKGLHLWGTCAGLIILANNLKLIELDIERNAYGSQINSFSSKIKFCNDNISVKFIRAPKIVNVGKNVDVLSVHNGDVIAVSNKNVFATTFHPEVTLDDTVYNYFTSRIRN